MAWIRANMGSTKIFLQYKHRTSVDLSDITYRSAGEMKVTVNWNTQTNSSKSLLCNLVHSVQFEIRLDVTSGRLHTSLWVTIILYARVYYTHTLYDYSFEIGILLEVTSNIILILKLDRVYSAIFRSLVDLGFYSIPLWGLLSTLVVPLQGTDWFVWIYTVSMNTQTDYS